MNRQFHHGGYGRVTLDFGAVASPPPAQANVLRMKICEGARCGKNFLTVALAPTTLCAACRELEARISEEQAISLSSLPRAGRPRSFDPKEYARRPEVRRRRAEQARQRRARAKAEAGRGAHALSLREST